MSTTELRDGTVTTDPRLDRIEQFDARSRAYGVADVVPEKIATKTWPCVLYLDQGQEGACVSFGWSHEAAASPAANKGITNEVAKARYWDIQRSDEWPGGSYPGATPVYEGTSVLAGAKYMTSLGYYDGYNWAFTIDEVLRSITNHGPVVLGLPWLDSMFDPDRQGVLDTSGTEAGGHCILARGVVVPRGNSASINVGKRSYTIKTSEPLVRLRNSWSKTWGVDGDAFVHASGLAKLLANQGEACVPMGRHLVKK